ncbi:glycosyltransferase family A protein, partial [Helicobacter canis]|uniref:glycosyltransferase family A protein n=1 Tax=Helicobacter canis TaxID=29419 RepID=UPI0026E96592
AKTPPVLVSLTSFPARLPYLHHTLYSILTQDYKDFHIALFLSSSEVHPDELPLILKIFKKLGLLSIHFVEENLRAYKKLFYALQAYPEHIIITIDDDQIYDPKLLSLLLESYKKFPHAIHTHLAYDGAYMADILELDSAAYCAIIKESSPHLALASVGVSGVLYPPRPFSQEFFNTQAILSLCPYSDDLWFFVMSVLNDVPKVLVQGALEHPKESSIAQDESPNLWEINCEQNRNYDQLRALLEAYPQARAKILKSLGLAEPKAPLRF